MPLARRSFWAAFLPVCALLSGSFLMVSVLLRIEVRRGLKNSLEETQRTLERTRSVHELRNSRLLAVIAENPSLKAGIDLWRVSGGTADVQRTLREQLVDIADVVDCDLLALRSAQDGLPIA